MKKLFGISLASWILIVCFLIGFSAYAAVSVETARHVYNGSGTTGPFPYLFKIWRDSDLEVAKFDANGGRQLLTLNVDYTVTGAGTDSGGNVILSTVLPAGYKLSIRRQMPLLQNQNFLPNNPVRAKNLNDSLDALDHQIQQVADDAGRTMQLPTDSLSGPLYLRPLANHLIGWDAAGVNLQNYATMAVQSASFDVIGNYGDDLATAVSTIGSGIHSLWIDKAITLTGDVIVPENITLHFLRTGRINGGYTLTMCSQPVAGPWQIFGDDVSLVFSNACTFRMNWAGTTSAAINKAFNAFAGRAGAVFVFDPGTTYTINSTVTFIDVGEYVTVYAYGAKFTGAYNAVWFEIHTPLIQEEPGHFLTGFNWHGGTFINSATTKTASVCMLVRNNRRGTQSDMWIQGFWKGLASIKSENQKIAKNLFYQCVWAVHVSGNHVGTDITQNMTIEGNHFTNAYSTENPSDAEAAIAFFERTNGLKIVGNTFSTDPSNGTHAAIYLIDKDPESTGSLPGHGHLISANHFEQSAGTIIWYDNTPAVGGTNLGFKDIRINDNSFTSVTGRTFTNIKLEKVIDGFILRNYMYQNPSTTITGVDLDADCVRINVTEPGKAGWTVSTNFVLACPRAQLNIHPSWWPVGEALTGYTNTAHATGTATINVWELLSNEHKYDEIPPKGYWVTLVAYDTASEASGGPVALKTDAAAANVSGCYIDLAGVPNGKMVHVTSYVPAGADGSLYIDKTASSGTNLFLTVYIKQLVR